MQQRWNDHSPERDGVIAGKDIVMFRYPNGITSQKSIPSMAKMVQKLASM